MNQTLTIVFGFLLPCLMTTLGASLIFFFNKSSKVLNIITIGLAAGIMMSASIWSLLLPSLENAEITWGNLAALPVVLGFTLGVVFMVLLDLLCTKFFKKNGENDKNKAFKLFTAITIHNIPEGLSVGFAVGTAIATQSAYVSAFMFALGISLQNFPEGLATALPMYSCLGSRKKAFGLGVLSGLVEPIFACAGFFLAASLSSLLPWLLAFSAGAMIYVIIEELLPEIHSQGKCAWGTIPFVIGFIIMMMLDICL